MRIVSLTCSNTEIVCALGCADFLVGVDSYSDYPQEVVSRLPRVGPDLSIDIDHVAELKPDLILASLTVPGHEKVVEGLENAQLPFIAPDPESLDDVYGDILHIGKLLGVSKRAHKVVTQMKMQMEPKQPLHSRPTMLIQWWPKPVIAPGKNSWVNDMMHAAGLDNPIGHREVISTPLSDEEVRKLNPDAIVISWVWRKIRKISSEGYLPKPNLGRDKICS